MKYRELHKKITAKMPATHIREFKTKHIGKYCEWHPKGLGIQGLFEWKYGENVRAMSKGSKLLGLVGKGE